VLCRAAVLHMRDVKLRHLQGRVSPHLNRPELNLLSEFPSSTLQHHTATSRLAEAGGDRLQEQPAELDVSAGVWAKLRGGSDGLRQFRWLPSQRTAPVLTQSAKLGRSEADRDFIAQCPPRSTSCPACAASARKPYFAASHFATRSSCATQAAKWARDILGAPHER
jgi:hypothetical protein